jgi:hypothetical protein
MAKGVSLKMDVEGMPELKRALKEIGEKDAPFLAEAMETVGHDLEANVAGRAPGSMGGKTQFVGVKGAGASQRAVVSVRHPGAAVREFGRGQMTISARRKKALSWPGARHPVRRAHQAGRPPRPFIGIKAGNLAVGATMDEAPSIIGRAVEREWARLTGGG